MKTFSPDGEAERLAALRACEILDTPPEVAFDRIVKLATQSLDVPVAAVSFVDDDRQWFKAAIGSPFCECPRQHSFCAHAILEDDVFVVPDATRDPRFAANPLVTGGTQVRFYAGAVLRAPGGQALGALCVVDTRPRELDERGRGILRDLAAMTMDALALRTRNLLLQEQHDLVQDRRDALTEINGVLQAEIAQQKRVDRERRRSEERYRQVFNRGSDQAIVHDGEGRIVDVNATTCETLGYTREELLALEINDIAEPQVSPEIRRMWQELPASEVATFQAFHRRKNGTLLPVEVRLSVLETAEGRRFLGLARDVTERRKQDALLQTRARQQQAIAQLGIATLRADAAHGDDALDRLFTEALILARETLQIEMCSVLERLPEANLFAVRAVHGLLEETQGKVITVDAGSGSPIGCALLTREPVVVDDFRTDARFEQPGLLRAHGITSALVVVIHAGGEQPFGALNAYSRRPQQFSADDVSFLQTLANILAAAIAREAAREWVQQALDEAAAARRTAEQANQAKSGFLSRMSHELRTPLNAILGFGQVLAMSAAPDPQEGECVQHILKAGHHLLGLVNEVLDLSRAETGGVVPLAQPRRRGPSGARVRGAGDQAGPGTAPALRGGPAPAAHHPLGRRTTPAAGAAQPALERHQVQPGGRPDRRRRRADRRARAADQGERHRPGVDPRSHRAALRALRAAGAGTRQRAGHGAGPGRLPAADRSDGRPPGGGERSRPGEHLPDRTARRRGARFRSRRAGARAPRPGPPPRRCPRSPPRRGRPPCSTSKTISPTSRSSGPCWPRPARAGTFFPRRTASRGWNSRGSKRRTWSCWTCTCPAWAATRCSRSCAPTPRTRHLPVFMLTADATAHAREQALADGADGFICKPFQVRYLLEKLEHALAESRADHAA